MKSPLVGCVAFVLGTALSASAENSYVIPWYANPVATNVAYSAMFVNDPADEEIAAKISTAWTAVSGESALSGKTALVKTMSDVNYFRPKFYVLCTNGDIVEFTMAKDLSSAVWANTLSAAKLAAAAGASGAATDLKVSDDGRLAFLNYGGTWKALGYAAPTWSIVTGGTAVCPHGHPVMIDSTGTYALHITKQRNTVAVWNNNDVAIGTLLTSGGEIASYNASLTGGSGSTVSGNAFCEGGSVSEYLDLSVGVATRSGDSTARKIRANWQFALGVPAGGRTPRVIVHSSNLDSINKIMGGWDGGYEEVVIDSAEIPAGTAARTDQKLDGFYPSVKRLVLNVPNLTPNAYGGFPYGDASGNIVNAAIASESRWDDFNFSNVTEFAGASFQNFTCGGTLDLPSVVQLNFGAFRCTCSTDHETPVEVLISPENKTVTNIVNQVFSGQSNIWRVVIGGHENGVTFSGPAYPYHFLGATKLREVEFTGGLPLFESGVGAVFPSSQANKTFAFVIPREEKWTNFIEGSYSPATDAEISSYMTANPGRYVPFGVVTNKNLFHTYAHQYVAYADSFGKGAPSPITLKLRYDETRGSVSVVAGSPADALGRYEDGTVLRLTAVPNSGVSFARWYGDIGTNDATSATITVEYKKNLFFAARFVNSWTIENYNSGKKTATATDGNFRINLTSMDSSNHTFTLGKGGYGGLFDITTTDNGDGSVTTNMLAGSSTVDLGGEFRLAGDSTPWVPTAFLKNNCLCLFPIAYVDTVKTFFSPGTIDTANTVKLFQVYSSSKTQLTTFETIVLDEPKMPGELIDGMFSGATRSVDNLILLLPSIGGIQDGGLWATKPSQDFASWDFSSVSNLTPKSMTTQWFVSNAESYRRGRKAYDCHGDLKLPALRKVDRSDEGGSALSPMPYMTSLVLGGKTKDDTVTSLANGAFAGNSAMTNLVIHADAAITVGTDIFASFTGREGSSDVVYPGHTPENMTFTGAAPNTDVFANLLAGVGKKDAPVIIMATNPGKGWTRTSYIDYYPTNEEKALAGDKADKVFGVYRSAGGNIKAVFLWPSRPLGFSIIFR